MDAGGSVSISIMLATTVGPTIQEVGSKNWYMYTHLSFYSDQFSFIDNGDRLGSLMLTNMELYHDIWLADRFTLSQSEAMTQFHVN